MLVALVRIMNDMAAIEFVDQCKITAIPTS